MELNTKEPVLGEGKKEQVGIKNLILDPCGSLCGSEIGGVVKNH